ncbi:o-spanin [Escherichia phage Mansfield]|uniref:O-spanin n=1 Tax=Escherichia phage Mansfield TaxID=2591099 RepID=A0A5B9NGD7_9CAUD|nr:o-spanin [Escherichia phage Mansfield]
MHSKSKLHLYRLNRHRHMRRVARKRNWLLMTLLLVTSLGISSCASNSAAPVNYSGVCPTLRPLDASLSQKETVDYQKRMSDFLFSSPQKQTD